VVPLLVYYPTHRVLEWWAQRRGIATGNPTPGS